MSFDIKTMFAGVDKAWLSIFTSPTIMPLLNNALHDIKGDIDVITPKPEHIFNFARTPYDNIKVIILGQDPPSGNAHGLAFSCEGEKISPSLNNIYKCLLKNNLIAQMPTTANLSKWAKQGVLLLNTSLTTKKNIANAHANAWREFTDALIHHISHDQLRIFMLWGHAVAKTKFIHEECWVYKWIHPSPLAQTTVDEEEQFINCTDFIKVNDVLTDTLAEKAIDWNPHEHPTDTHVIFTDGGCDMKGDTTNVFSKAGYAVYFSKGPFEKTIKYGQVPFGISDNVLYPTNIRAEGLAIIIALEHVISGPPANVMVITDSKFWIQMINEYIPLWLKKGVDFKEKKNPDLTIRMYDIVTKIRAQGLLEFIHIASHNKNKNAPADHIKGNAIVDKYATIAKQLESFDMITETI